MSTENNERRYYLAAEGGGSKLLTILYDDRFNILRTTRSGGTGTTFRAPEVVEAEIREVAATLIPDGCGIGALESIDYSFGIGSLGDELKKRCEVKAIVNHGEGSVALSSAGGKCGIVAQAGTGSDSFMIQPDCDKVVGGWGPTVGDEGSGYSIGISVILAAIYSFDGRGEKTVLEEMLYEHLGIDRAHIRDGILGMVYKSGARPKIAALTRIAAKAAAAGDAVALGIFEKAGHEMSAQVLASIRNYGKKWEGPIVASGGAWKAHPKMFETFCADIHAKYPDAEIRHPVFEPVVGCIVERLSLGENAQMTPEEAIGLLREPFAEYAYGLDKH